MSQLLWVSGSQKVVGSIPWKWGEPPTVCPLKVPADQGGEFPRNSWLLWAPVKLGCSGSAWGGGVEWNLCRPWICTLAVLFR